LACQKVREQMEAALVETPPPSLIEVARRLGYRHPSTLQLKFPELSKRISANYRSSERYLSGRRSRRTVPQFRPEKDSQRKAIEQELGQPCPSSLKELARRWGYADGHHLKGKFPELCQALMEKRRECQQQKLAERLRNYRQFLEAAMKEDPPPRVISVARRLGAVTIPFLREHFAEECRRISLRYIEYRKKRMKDAGERLQQSLQENPPRSLNQISKEVGYHLSTLARNYPEICRSIMERYGSYAGTLAAERKRARLIASALRPLEA
jgi:AraC-like DNA-binding protein